MTGMGGIGMGLNEMDDDFDLGMDDETEDVGGLDDLGGDEGGMDLGGDDLDDMGDDLGADEEESVTVTRQEFEDAVMQAVESAWGSLSGGEEDLGGGLDDLGDEGGLGDDLGGDLADTDEGLDDLGGEDEFGDEELESECYPEEAEGMQLESVNRIANLLTEDPDVFARRRRRQRRR